MTTYNPIDGNYLTRRFKQIFPDTESFTNEYKASDLATSIALLTDDHLKIVYALLYARYANSAIASYDETQFKYKVFSIIFMYGPTWAKRLEAQKMIRELSLDELALGSKAIYNSALNPGGAPSTGTTDELSYINQQNTTNYKKSKAGAIATMLELLDTDVTSEFVNKFKKLFVTIVQPDYPLYYVTTPAEQEILEGDI